MCIAHRLLLSTSEISDATASMPSPGYFALQHRVAPPRKAYSLTSSAFIAFGALYPLSLFKPVFRGFLRIFLGICVHSFLYDSSRSCQRLRHHASILTQFGMIVNRFVKIHQSKNRFVKIHQSSQKTQDVFGSFRGSVSCRPRL